MCVYQESVESLPRPGELVCSLQLCFPSPPIPPPPPRHFRSDQKSPFPRQNTLPRLAAAAALLGSQYYRTDISPNATLFRELPKVRKGEKHNTNLGHGRSPPPPRRLFFLEKHPKSTLPHPIPSNDSRYASERDKIFPPLTLSEGFYFSFC